MLENARRGSCQQVRVKLGIEEERYAERSEEGGRRRGEEIETGSKLRTRPRECMYMCAEGWKREPSYTRLVPPSLDRRRVHLGHTVLYSRSVP
jgi:hypothetical protein